MALTIQTFTLGMLHTNAFLLTDQDKPGEAVLIDAPLGAREEIGAELGDDLKLTQLLLTHGHFDHVEDAAALRDMTGAKTVAHPDDKDFFDNPSQLAAMMMPGAKIDPVVIDEWVEAGQQIDVLGHTVEVRHVPGHAPGNILFYFAKEKKAFVGDAIFYEGVGRPDIPGGHWPTLEKSIKEQIYTLPDDVTLYSGHGSETSVAHEKSANPYVQA